MVVVQSTCPSPVPLRRPLNVPSARQVDYTTGKSIEDQGLDLKIFDQKYGISEDPQSSK